jgi:ABC-type uncharacterized transport system substrate-binding protein
MTRFLKAIFAAALVTLAFGSGGAKAHPHVFVTIKAEIVYDADGKATGIRHAWTFDDMFSTYATQGLESKQKGVFTKEELAPLAEVNVTSMKEFDFFTQGQLNGQKIEFGDPKDYWLDYTNQELTLHFTLPLKTPVAVKDLNIDIYDPVYFVSFELDDKEPVRLVAAPANCKLNVAKPNDKSAQTKNLGESFFNNMDPKNPFGTQFANKISVKSQ